MSTCHCAALARNSRDFGSIFESIRATHSSPIPVSWNYGALDDEKECTWERWAMADVLTATGTSGARGSKKPQNDNRSPSMRKHLLISVSTLALIASAGISAAQDRMGPGGASGAPAAQQAP